MYGIDWTGHLVKVSKSDGKILWRHALPKGCMDTNNQLEAKTAYDVTGNYIYVFNKHGIFKADMSNSHSVFTLIMPAKESKLLSGNYYIDDMKVYDDQKFYLLAEYEYECDRMEDVGLYVHK